MNYMSKLSNLCGKLTQEIKLSDGTIVVFKAPKVEDLAEIMGLFDEAEAEKFSGEQLIKTSGVLKKLLKQSIPDATDEEIEEVALLEMKVLMEGLSELLKKAFGGNTPKK